MIFYSLAPTIGEWAVERGLTHAYHDLSAVDVTNWLPGPAAATIAGLADAAGAPLGIAGATLTRLTGYVLAFLAYLTFVVRRRHAHACTPSRPVSRRACHPATQEWAIYWIHRYLHDNRTLYKLLHETHHIYNNRNSLSPFAGLAFDPIDGLLQVRQWVCAGAGWREPRRQSAAVVGRLVIAGFAVCCRAVPAAGAFLDA